MTLAVPFVGAITGIILRAKNAPIGIWGLSIYLFGGTILSYFVTPAIADIFDLTDKSTNAISFILGAIGLLILEASLQVAGHIKDHPESIKIGMKSKK